MENIEKKPLNAKITKIVSTHNNLRTNDMVGVTPQIPEVGKFFSIFGESLSFKGGMRAITTTLVQESNFDSATKTFTFKTENSTYTLEILDKDLSDEQIMAYAGF